MNIFIRSVLISVLFLMISLNVEGEDEKKVLMRKEALMIVEKTPEIRAFYNLYSGRLVNCIEKSVLKTCESDWVTCIDDAWVVQFTVGKMCPVVHDGRLSVTMLVDSITGEIISRFPEEEYLKIPGYCLDDHDCLTPSGSDGCENFIFGQLSSKEALQKELCECRDFRCVRK